MGEALSSSAFGLPLPRPLPCALSRPFPLPLPRPGGFETQDFSQTLFVGRPCCEQGLPIDSKTNSFVKTTCQATLRAVYLQLCLQAQPHKPLVSFGHDD